MKVYYKHNIPLHVLATHVAILREVHDKGWDTSGCNEFVNQCTDVTYEVLKIHGLRYILKFKIQIKICD